MRVSLLAVLVVAPCIASATPRKPKAAVAAVPASASKSPAGKKHASPLIDSDLGGRDLAFLANAVELGKAQRFLAEQADRTANPDLRGYGEELVKGLAAQSVVLNTVAEMRKIRISDGQSDTERRIAAKIANLEGARLEKALLDHFRETDRRALATYEFGTTSKDPTIQNLCGQTLPKIREHLAIVDAMAGITPKRVEDEAAAPEAAPVAEPQPQPAFRANVRPPGDNSQAAIR